MAAHDSPIELKRRADIVCTGFNDQEAINSVIQRGDSVEMVGGTYYISDTLDLSKTLNSVIVGNHIHWTGQGGGIRV